MVSKVHIALLKPAFWAESSQCTSRASLHCPQGGFSSFLCQKNFAASNLKATKVAISISHSTYLVWRGTRSSCRSELAAAAAASLESRGREETSCPWLKKHLLN